MQHDKSMKAKCIKALEKLDELYKAGLLSSRVYADLSYEYKNEANGLKLTSMCQKNSSAAFRSILFQTLHPTVSLFFPFQKQVV